MPSSKEMFSSLIGKKMGVTFYETNRPPIENLTLVNVYCSFSYEDGGISLEDNTGDWLEFVMDGAGLLIRVGDIKTIFSIGKGVA